jgi:signal transduction histidine kinase
VDQLDKLRRQLRGYIFVFVLIDNLLLLEAWWANKQYLHWSLTVTLPFLLGLAVILPLIASAIITHYALQPLQAVWQANLHIVPGQHQVTPPRVETLHIGRELVTSLMGEVYQMVTKAEHPAETPTDANLNQATFIANNMPLPIFIIASDQTIVFANTAASSYLSIDKKDMLGSNNYSVLDMAFSSDQTLDSWLSDVKEHNATATNSWERVRLSATDKRPAHYLDLAAYYNQGNESNFEQLLVLFDHTSQYSQDDQAVSFIALTVHELRTPLTLLRGYIEVFQEELGGQLSPELADFMHKMQASAEQLTAFVNNILNVARVEEDQLSFQLQEEVWAPILKRAVETMELRARVRGIELECAIADNLPTVGVDRVSIQEVVNNLIDNAIKYSGASKKIRISSGLNKEGQVETTVQDWGVGVPTAIMPNLFKKFYRDHHHRAQIGGTGLGLYLSKAIVTAHGGNIWVRSREGQGSNFSFTLQPFSQLHDAQKGSAAKTITRSAHGWIKNHSLYRH